MNGILHPIPSIKAPTRLIAALYQVLSAANYLACARSSACLKGGGFGTQYVGTNNVTCSDSDDCHWDLLGPALVLTGDNDAATSTGRQRLWRQRVNHQWQPWSHSTARRWHQPHPYPTRTITPSSSSPDDLTMMSDLAERRLRRRPPPPPACSLTRTWRRPQLQLHPMVLRKHHAQQPRGKSGASIWRLLF